MKKTLFAAMFTLLVGSSVQFVGQAAPGANRPHFEPASVAVPAGSRCMLHPEGNSDPNQSIRVSPDGDGVARFLAVRPTQPNSVDRLALDCTSPDGISQTYSVDLRSEATFGERPFDPVAADLTFRPGLSGDPLSYTQEQLLERGYGLRPDPSQNPGGYQRWLAAAINPAYMLADDRSSASASNSHSRHIQSAAGVAVHEMDAGVVDNPSNFWTGAVLSGSFKKGATSADTYNYLWNEATFNVPTVTPGGHNTGITQMSIWNGLDEYSGSVSPLLQAVVFLQTTSTTAKFWIQHQDFGGWIKCPASPRCTNSGNDEAARTFTPKQGDSVYAEEWYCDAGGHLNLHGGYACTYMLDNTQRIVWNCTIAGSKGCQSYALPNADLANGNLGRTADYIIEMDTCQAITGPGSCGSTTPSQEWPDFSPVTMTGAAFVVKGVGTSGSGNWVSTNGCVSCTNSPTTDPAIQLNTDNTASIPFVRGDGHLLITLPSSGVKWAEKNTNVYLWNGTNFNHYTPQCATSIGLGANSRGLTNGTPWVTECTTYADGNHDVYEMQTGGAWVKMQGDIAVQVAVSPDANHAWAIDAKNNVLYWNGSKFVASATPHCATSIAVGENSRGLTNGTPWITGCATYADGNHDVYEMQTGGAWVLMQSDIATQIAVSPVGNHAWAINDANDVLYWNGSKFLASPTAHCATAIAVGDNSRGLTNGTPWITGCATYADGNHSIYQMQTGGAWVDMQNDVGIHIGVSPVGNLAWATSTLQP
ncbi:MAG TPA: hypothetical protein VKV39_06700 [Candidatus Sulfotelmatobacter sp.]|nr:hypothetical protein [Candidatus Sulfotelmatobacter sp.]